MNNQFDERLTSRISDVFDNYEDNFADEGWKELRKRFPVKQQRNPVIYWIGSAAAALILAIGIWTVLPTLKTEEITIAKVDVPKEKPQDVQVSTAETGQAVENSSPAGPSKSRVSHPSKNERLAYSSIPAKRNNKVTVSSDPIVIEKTENNAASQMMAGLVATDTSSVSSFESKPGVKVLSEPALLATNTEPVAAPKKRTLLDLALEEKNKISESKSSSKRVTFGVYAGSFVSYAEGSDNKVNLGAGFTSDIALTKKLKLSTGISIAQNTLSFAGSNDIPVVAQSNFDAAFAPKTDPLSFRQPLTYNLDKYDATLLGVDIPINLKYSLSDNKRDMFVSAGFSSGAFINESYTYHYSSASAMESSLPAGSVSADVQNEDKMQKDFGNFDIARMLNFSFGIGYPIGKQQKLVIEPFVRYPLKGIGAENLRFGAGGVNLKLNFETGKGRR